MSMFFKKVKILFEISFQYRNFILVSKHIIDIISIVLLQLESTTKHIGMGSLSHVRSIWYFIEKPVIFTG